MALIGGWYTLGFTKSDHTEAFLLHVKPNVNFHQNSSSGVMIIILGGWYTLGFTKSDHTEVLTAL